MTGSFPSLKQERPKKDCEVLIVEGGTGLSAGKRAARTSSAAAEELQVVECSVVKDASRLLDLGLQATHTFGA